MVRIVLLANTPRLAPVARSNTRTRRWRASPVIAISVVVLRKRGSRS
jgi:hypothetical protein